jgi:hypothetical protein
MVRLFSHSTSDLFYLLAELDKELGNGDKASRDDTNLKSVSQGTSTYFVAAFDSDITGKPYTFSSELLSNTRYS